MREIKGNTLQEHLWNSMEEVSEYSTWHWVELFEYFKIPINDSDYKAWVKDAKKEGRTYFRKSAIK